MSGPPEHYGQFDRTPHPDYPPQNQSLPGVRPPGYGHSGYPPTDPAGPAYFPQGMAPPTAMMSYQQPGNPYAGSHYPQYDAPAPPRADDATHTAGVLMLVGGILSLVLAFSHFLAALSLCLTVFTGIYLLISGVLCTIKGSQLLGRDGYLQNAPQAHAVLLIFNILACDVIGMVLGIVTLTMIDRVGRPGS